MEHLFSGLSFRNLANTQKKPPKPGDLGPGGIYHEKQAGI